MKRATLSIISFSAFVKAGSLYSQSMLSLREGDSRSSCYIGEEGGVVESGLNQNGYVSSNEIDIENNKESQEVIKTKGNPSVMHK